MGKFAPFLLAATLAGCDITSPDGTRAQRDLESAIARWESARVTNYDLLVERLCYCAVAGEPVRVRVRGDAVADAYYVRSGEPVPALYAGLFPSVRGLFRVVQDAIDRDVDALEVEYDPDLGFPRYIRVDPRRRTADDEYEIFAEDLRVR